jgi:hypothetical protein
MIRQFSIGLFSAGALRPRPRMFRLIRRGLSRPSWSPGPYNIFDKDPPISSDLAIYNRNGGANGNVYTGTYDSLGRMIFASLSAKF